MRKSVVEAVPVDIEPRHQSTDKFEYVKRSPQSCIRDQAYQSSTQEALHDVQPNAIAQSVQHELEAAAASNLGRANADVTLDRVS